MQRLEVGCGGVEALEETGSLGDAVNDGVVGETGGLGGADVGLALCAYLVGDGGVSECVFAGAGC